MSETRKIAAILATDAVGYSRLMGEDEAGTARPTRMRARWTRRRPPWPTDGLRKAGLPEE
jgi:hypothetical protein